MRALILPPQHTVERINRREGGRERGKRGEKELREIEIVFSLGLESISDQHQMLVWECEPKGRGWNLMTVVSRVQVPPS